MTSLDATGPLWRILRARLTRRQFVAGTLGLAGAFALRNVALGQAPPPPEDTTKTPGQPAQLVGTRSPYEQAQRLKVGSQTWFAPLDRFYGSLTPSELHFMVAHAGIPSVDPATYKLLVHGMVERPRVFTLEDIKRFPSTTITCFIECAGNSANAWFRPLPSDTVQNVHGLTGACEWTGVPLSTLLAEVGPRKEATWLLAESQDAAVYARSIPIAKAWQDILVAYGQNGEALRPEQGYPIRLVVPGWEGSANVKWLRRIELSDRPFMTRDETAKYTDVMPGGKALQFTFQMGVKSLITWPSGGLRVPARGFWETSGLAWSGAGKIVRVDVSTDGGRTWGQAALQGPVLPRMHTRFRFPWTWDGSEAVLMSRATDDQGNVQPGLDALVRERGLDSLYHNNAIQAWKVDRNGDVFSTHGPFARVPVPGRAAGDLCWPGCVL